jgi:PTS system beta-glucosides-specific IIC component
MIEDAGLETVTPMLICNSDDYTEIVPHTGKDVSTGEPVLELFK